MSNLKDFGAKIKARRIELNMTQDELAKAAGYTSRSSINKIELGMVDVSQSKVAKLAKALKISPTILVGWGDIYNNGIIGNNNQNNNISNGKVLTPIQSAIVTVCSALTEKQQSDVLSYATALLSESKK